MAGAVARGLGDSDTSTGLSGGPGEAAVDQPDASSALNWRSISFPTEAREYCGYVAAWRGGKSAQYV